MTARREDAATAAGGRLHQHSNADTSARYVAAFRKGLSETGNVEGQNVTVEYHWLEGQYGRLPALAAGRPNPRTRTETVVQAHAAHVRIRARVQDPVRLLNNLHRALLVDEEHWHGPTFI
jgi:hypothetical protein